MTHRPVLTVLWHVRDGVLIEDFDAMAYAHAFSLVPATDWQSALRFASSVVLVYP